MSTHDKASATRIAFTVPHDVLLPALTFTAKAVSSRPSLPVLTGALLASDGKTVTVEAFDYEQARSWVLDGATCTAPGSVLVSAKKLLEMVKMLRKGEQVTVADEGVRVRLTDGKTRYTLPTMPVEDYPERPQMPATVGLIDGPALAAVIGQVAKFSGTDETLPMMTGIRVFSKGKRLSLESTDRYRLAVRDFDWANEVDEFSALVRGKMLAEVVGAIAKPKGTVVTLGHAGDKAGEGWFGIEAGPARVVVRTLDGANYPPVRSLIPAAPTQEVDVDAADLIATTKRVAVACERATPVLLGFTADTITIEAGGAEEATAAEDVACEYVGATPQQRAEAMKAQIRRAVKEARATFAKAEPERRDKAITDAKQRVIDAFAKAGAMTVGVNPAYLVDVVATLDAKRVRLGLLDPFKPFTVVPLDGDGAPVAGVTNLIMPIRVSRGEPEQPAAKPQPEAAAKGGVQVVPVDGPVNATDVTVVPGVGTTSAAPETAEPETPEPVAAAAPAVVLDRNVPHTFVRKTDNGKPVVWSTRCVCGSTFNAKVHDEQPAAPAAPAAPVEPAAPAPVEPVDDGRVWMAVLGLAARINGRMVTHATVKGAGEAVKEFGYGKTTGVLVVKADDGGKRMYVGTRSQDDANLMHQVACKHRIPVHVERGVWPSQGAAAGNQEVPQVKANDNEKTPVVPEQGDRSFDHDVAAREAFTKAHVGDFDGAMALVEQGQAADRESGKPHVFRDRNQREYGWGRIRDGILAMQVEAEIRAEGDAEADMAAEGVTAQAAEPVEVEAVEVDEPQADADAEPETATVEADADEDDDLARALRAALAGQAPEIIEGAIRGARAKAAKAAASARPQPKAATEPKRTAPKQAPAKQAAKQAAPVAAGAGVDWAKLGMAEPTSKGVERVYELPAGTLVRKARKALHDAIGEAFDQDALAERPGVTQDKSERLNKLRVAFTSPAALAAAADVVDLLAADVLPEFMPQRANA